MPAPSPRHTWEPVHEILVRVAAALCGAEPVSRAGQILLSDRDWLMSSSAWTVGSHEQLQLAGCSWLHTCCPCFPGLDLDVGPADIQDPIMFNTQ